MKAIVKVKLETEQMAKIQYLYKVGSDSEMNSWRDSSVR